jgi:hypothetical protein
MNTCLTIACNEFYLKINISRHFHFDFQRIVYCKMSAMQSDKHISANKSLVNTKSTSKYY